MVQKFPLINSRRVASLIVIILVMAVTIGAVAAYYLARGDANSRHIAQSAGHENGDEHADHAHHDHENGEQATVKLSAAALKNIRYKPHTVATGDYVRTVSMPGIIIERPGKSQTRVTVPLTGIVTRVYVHEGEAIPQDSPLFDLRLTHEDLVTEQTEFLATVDALDVVKTEIERLEAVTEGVIAGKRILEQKYERQKLEARLQAQRQALLLHGLVDDQIDEILKTRYLIQSLTIRAPSLETHDEHPYHVQSIDVQLGQQVTAGDTLCVLADHRELFIEGTAFEADTPQLRAALEAGTPVAADVLISAKRDQVVTGLKLLYLADQVDRESRAQHFYVRLPNKIVSDRREGSQRFVQWQFSPGQRVELNLPVEHWTNRIVVPAAAVVTDGAESYVYRQSGDSFERVPVHVEHRDKKSAVITSDGSIFPGEVIAGSGAFQIHLALKNKSGGGADPHAGHNH
ncbi:MAG: efflux RND transporter periplasmic adaptor subunit [Planctomycetes bacterium]|nr:efflux RND transporter periplasmic adaptor subunit [Planctomycetota bacterium]